MTVLSGLFEGLLARVVPRLRPLFPPEVTGLVVTMVGVQLVALGCPRFLGFQDGLGPQGTVTTVATVTLAAMIGPTVWGKGKLKLYPVLIGLVVGYLLAYFFGRLSDRTTAGDARRANDQPAAEGAHGLVI